MGWEAYVKDIDKLNDSNFDTWSVEVKSTFQLADIWVAIEDPTSAEGIAASTKAKALLVLTVEPSYKRKVHEADTAKAAWDMLEFYYKQLASARLVQYDRSLATLRMRGGETLREYFARAEALGDNMIAAGHEFKDGALLRRILAGLPESYDDDVKYLYRIGNDSVNVALGELLATQEQRKFREQVQREEYGLAAAAVMKPKHYKASSAQQQQTVEPKPQGKGRTCFFCDQPGHEKMNCPERSEWLAWKEQKKIASQQPQEEVKASTYRRQIRLAA